MSSIRSRKVPPAARGFSLEVDELTVVDLGGLGGLARAGLDLVDAEIERESDREWVRTMDIEGHPAKVHFERGYDEDEIEVAIFVGERFVVAMEIEGEDLSEEIIKDILDDFDLDDLEDLE